MLSGRHAGAEEAEKIGLAIAAPGGADEVAAERAGAYLENSGMAGNAILHCAEAALEPDRESGRNLELSEIERLCDQGDAKGRIAAFIESRKRRGTSLRGP